MGMERAAAIVLSGVLLSSCVPLMGHYYGPSTPGGVVSRHECHGKAGEMTNVEFERGSVKILVIPDNGSASSLIFTAQLYLRPEDIVDTSWNNTEVMDSAGNKVPTDIKGIYAHKSGVPITLTSNNDLISGNEFSGRDYALYEVEIEVKDDLPDEFVLVFPTTVVNGIVYPPTRITYTKQFGMWLQFLNC